jgi:NTE family protein
MTGVTEGAGTKLPAIFEGVPPDDLAAVLARSEQRRFEPGDVMIAEGDAPDKVFVVNAGSADVTVVDRDGVEHQVGRVGHGTTLGEMSLVTGENAAATVRAATPIDATILTGREFERLATRFPLVYRNIGAMLAERLAKTNRLVAEARLGQIVSLEHAGAPAELPWALACSVSWHTRAPTLLLVVDPDATDDLHSLAERHRDPSPGRATMRIVSSQEALRRGSLGSEIEEYRNVYDNILVVMRGDDAVPLTSPRRLVLAGEQGGTHTGDHLVRAWARDVPRVLGPDAGGAVSVPALARGETAHLRDGILPNTTGAGRSLGWLARDIAGLKVGFAFGAGSMRGYAHVGVIRQLEAAGLAPDYVAGTSVGSAVAALYADGRGPDELADELDRCGKVLFRPTLSRRGFLSNRALRRYLESNGPDRTFEDMNIPLAIVAADLDLQQEVVIRTGLVWMAVLSSISIPGIFPANQMGGRTLVDGGVLNPVPASAVAGMGAGGIVSVRLGTPRAAPTSEIVAADITKANTSALNVILHSLDIMQGRIGEETLDTPVITLEPDFSELPPAKLRHFSMGRQYIEPGAAATEAALPRLSTLFPWLRPRTDD